MTVQNPSGLAAALPATPPKTSALEARVLSAPGRQALVDLSGVGPTVCQIKGRELTITCHDRVLVDLSQSPPVILDRRPRQNLVLRQEGPKTKLLAANIDLALIVISGHPLFSPEAVGRLMASLLDAEIPCCIVLNKSDLAAETRQAVAVVESLMPLSGLAPFDLVQTQTRDPDGCAGLRAYLAERFPVQDAADRAVLLAGQSGMGKSSLLNALIPDAQARTQAISEALQTGRHTTTSSRSYPLRPGLALIDTPGFQRFGIEHLSPERLRPVFPDFMAMMDAQLCRFRDCRHESEPGCSVLAGTAALAAQGVGAERLQQRLWLWAQLLRGVKT